MPEHGDSPVVRLGKGAWHGALWLAVVAGTLHIAELFSVGLSADTLTGAGRGVLLLLIALGLAGNARLAMILAFVFSLHALTRLTGGPHTLAAVSWAELALLTCSLVALLAGLVHLRPDEPPAAQAVETASKER